MRHVSSVLALTAALLPIPMTAQAAHTTPTVPTTKILAIGSLTAPITTEEMKTIMPNEVRDTVNLYLEGKIDQWWFRQDGNGVVFLLNVTSIEEADAILEKLPLGIVKRMKFQLLQLGPLSPLRILLREQSAKQNLARPNGDSTTNNPR
ncbi:hypothetical protein [Granulicella arctica]|uniref:Muconolactone isomerase domain-containing protein n=1 Tax=Granulicella arctica TaxID=940613 RepID=A0A7Y9PFP1_9BACT|nr:hypothetical protein [Granulicella arctica]NYF79039.1 hypothetical protein [Granulicella arctica]